MANELRVGGKAPSFTLENTRGETVTLEALRGKKNVVLLFYRADWCPYCAEQLSSLQNFIRDLEDQDAALIAVSADSIKKGRNFAEKICINYPLYSDPDLKVINSYGVLDAEYDIARPSVFVIDKEGRIRYTHVSRDHTDRPMNTTIITALKIVNGRMPEKFLPMYRQILGMVRD